MVPAACVCIALQQINEVVVIVIIKDADIVCFSSTLLISAANWRIKWALFYCTVNEATEQTSKAQCAECLPDVLLMVWAGDVCNFIDATRDESDQSGMRVCGCVTHSGVCYHRHTSLLAGMLSARGQCGQHFRPRSRSMWPLVFEGCPHGLVVSHRNHVSYVKFFSDRNCCLLCNILLKSTFE